MPFHIFSYNQQGQICKEKYVSRNEHDLLLEMPFHIFSYNQQGQICKEKYVSRNEHDLPLEMPFHIFAPSLIGKMCISFTWSLKQLRMTAKVPDTCASQGLPLLLGFCRYQ